MLSELHVPALRTALAATLLSLCASTAFSAPSAPPGNTHAAPAAASVMRPPDAARGPSGGTKPGPIPAPAAQAPAKPAWTFPAPLAGKPPQETWLPHLLSNEDRAHRAAEDRALMFATHARMNQIFNAGLLQDELKDGQYDELESQLNAVLDKFLADPAYELVLQASANFAEEGHAHGRVADTAWIQAWVKARPNSPWAHYSAGLRWSDTAWGERGNGWASDVSEAQWKKVHEDEVRARADIKAALKIDPKLAIAWVTLMNIDRSDPGAGLDQVTADFNQGSKQVPTSYLIPDQYEETLEPRWMGSAAMMDDFAQSQLTNLDRNPRFWDLQGDSLADSGCAACNDYHWDVSLKQYNAALAYADRPSWLAAAGEAALHLHRYALAHAYYDRALAYKDDLYLSMYRDFTVQLCDPSKTPEEVEKYRKDVVAYGGLDNVQYPHAPDDCVVYQRELPWGTEPVPDTTGLRVYAIDSLSHPVYQKEPQPMSMPDQAKSVTSPDGKWEVTLADVADKTYRLMLHGQATGKTTGIYMYTGVAMVGFTSDSMHLLVSDWTAGTQGGCHYFDLRDPTRHANLKAMVIQWAADQHLSVDVTTLRVVCAQFVNDGILDAALSGSTDKGQQLFQIFHYDMDTGKLVATH